MIFYYWFIFIDCFLNIFHCLSFKSFVCIVCIDIYLFGFNAYFMNSKNIYSTFDIDYKCLPNQFNFKILAIFSLYNLLI